MVRYILLMLFIVFLGVAGVVVFGYFALTDWNALQKAYEQFKDVIQSSSNIETLFAAEAQQNIHRINLFAEGVWALLSAILASIGFHGVCTLYRRPRANG